MLLVVCHDLLDRIVVHVSADDAAQHASPVHPACVWCSSGTRKVEEGKGSICIGQLGACVGFGLWGFRGEGGGEATETTTGRLRFTRGLAFQPYRGVAIPNGTGV